MYIGNPYEYKRGLKIHLVDRGNIVAPHDSMNKRKREITSYHKRGQ